jgi:hypothetical protein
MQLPKAALKPDKREVLRYLGYRETTGLLPRHLESLLDDCLRQGKALAEPRYRLKALPADRIPDGMLWPQCCAVENKVAAGLKAVFFLVTIGLCLENEVNACFQRNNYARGAVLDAVGTELVEKAANLVEQKLSRFASHRGWEATPRFSPGYGDWPLTAQPALVALLRGPVIGVKVTASCMLEPQKTISAAVLLGKGKLPPFSRGCAVCCQNDCCYRKEI